MKHLCLTRQTILFETWNNIVSSGKQPCWRSETLQLAIRYINLHSFTSSLSRNNCNSIILHSQPVRQHTQQHSTGQFGVQKETHFVRTASKWIWRIAREGASQSPPRILAQRRALWSDSFDRMSFCYFRLRGIPLDASFSSPSFSSDGT